MKWLYTLIVVTMLVFVSGFSYSLGFDGARREWQNKLDAQVTKATDDSVGRAKLVSAIEVGRQFEVVAVVQYEGRVVAVFMPPASMEPIFVSGLTPQLKVGDRVVKTQEGLAMLK